MKKLFFILICTVLSITSTYAYSSNVFSTKAIKALELLLTPDGEIGAIPISDYTPSSTTNRLYNSSGTLYWGDSAIITTSGTPITENSIPRMGSSGLEDSALSDDGSGVVAYDSSRSITGLYHLTDKKYVDEAVTALGARYYMLNTASGESDYKLCASSAPGGGEQSVSGTSLSDDDYIQGWIAPNTNEPDKLLLGVYNWRIYAEKTSGTKILRLYWKLVERKNDDSEVVIGTSVVSNEITSGKSSYIIPLTLSADHDIASDSYVVGKIHANVSGGGNAPSVTLYYEGDSASHWQIPVNTEIFNNTYVNIDGDTMTGDLVMSGANIDLGTGQLVGEGGTSGVYVDSAGNIGIATTDPGYELDVNGTIKTSSDSIIVATSQSPGSSDACTTGEIAWDASYIYICTASGVWKRSPLTGGY